MSTINSKLEDINLSIRLAKLKKDPELSKLLYEQEKIVTLVNLQDCVKELPKNNIEITETMTQTVKNNLLLICKLYNILKSYKSSNGKHTKQFYDYFNDYESKHNFNCGPDNIDMMILMVISKILLQQYTKYDNMVYKELYDILIELKKSCENIGIGRKIKCFICSTLSLSNDGICIGCKANQIGVDMKQKYMKLKNLKNL